jgi:hypothetical protein
MCLEQQTFDLVKKMIGLFDQKYSAKKSNPDCNQLDSRLKGLVDKDKNQHDTNE